jgi:PTH2 family peptidyl-tRNA hydrolase
METIGNLKDIKQVIVMRKDLNMRKGKMVAQGAHASMKVFFDMVGKKYVDIDKGTISYVVDLPSGEMGKGISVWIEGIFKKVCCGVNSEEDLLKIHIEAQEKGIPCALIKDAGITEFNGVHTYTCCAIGPAKAELIDEITGDLKLL